MLENQPTLLMRDGEFLDDALASCRMTRSDLAEKLRMASVTDLNEVRAVILETTGDVSVIRGETLQTDVLKGVRTRSSGRDRTRPNSPEARNGRE